MSTWSMMFSVAVGVTAGTEIARRRAARTGKIFCFQPVWLYYCHIPASAMTIALFHYSATASLASPTSQSVWMLIGSAVTMFVLQAAYSETEIRIAKRQLNTLTAVSDKRK